MIDSRLKQVAALLDDARSLLVEIVDEGPAWDRDLRAFDHIDAARQFINSSLVYVQKADSDYPGGDAA